MFVSLVTVNMSNMSAAEDDTELRDLLIQNLENSGVLSKLKAELRAAVFLAMEEQDRTENKSPLVNENLKKYLNTRDGRLVASLVMDFLHVFNLDFTLSVLQAEISCASLASRQQLCRELSISETDVNRNTPVLLEVVSRGRQRDTRATCSEELSPRQVTELRRTFDLYDKEQTGAISRDQVAAVLADVFPNFNRNLLEKHVGDELRPANLHKVSFQELVGVSSCLLAQCSSVVTQDPDPPTSQKAEGAALHLSCGDSRHLSSCEQGAVEEDRQPEDGDSFFDDPLPPSPSSQARKQAPAKDSSHGSLSALSATQRSGGSSEHTELSQPGRSRELKTNDRSLSLHLDDDVEYDEDFNSHRSDLSRSQLSVAEEIEEVSIDGPDDSQQCEHSTEDISVSQLSQTADYMEDVP